METVTAAIRFNQMPVVVAACLALSPSISVSTHAEPWVRPHAQHVPCTRTVPRAHNAPAPTPTPRPCATATASATAPAPLEGRAHVAARPAPPAAPVSTRWRRPALDTACLTAPVPARASAQHRTATRASRMPAASAMFATPTTTAHPPTAVCIVWTRRPVPATTASAKASFSAPAPLQEPANARPHTPAPTASTA